MRRINQTIIKQHFEKDPNDSAQTKWLIDVFNATGTNCRKISEKLHVSRQLVSCWLRSEHKIQYAYIFVICKTYNLQDDPEEVYKMIEEDFNHG